MDVPSMVQRSGDTLIVRSVVSGNQIYFDQDTRNALSTPPHAGYPSAQQHIQSQENELQSAAEHLKDEGLPQCKIKRNYSCNYCTYFTQNPRYHLTHLRDVHGEKIVINKCKLCLYASRHYQKLVRHMKMVHGSTEGIAGNHGQSRKRNVNRDTIRKRKNDAVENGLILPSNLQQQFQQQLEQQQKQVQQQYEQQEYQQKQQQLLQFSLPKMESPMSGSIDEAPQNRLLKCSVCDFTTLYQAQLVDHEQEEHCRTKFFRCDKCTYVTHIKARFSKHVKYHSMPMIKCVTCDFRTPYKWNLDRHMKNHGGAGPFKCAACDFTADIKQSLTVHEMNHHVPPVGHAAGMSLARRRNKVGGTDISDDYLSDMGDAEDHFNNNNNIDDFDESFAKRCKYEVPEEDDEDDEQPTDLSQKGNFHGSAQCPQKKSTRPVPNLIPIQSTNNALNLSKDLASSRNSLKDIAALYFGENQIPDIIMQMDKADTAQLSPSSNNSAASKRKAGSSTFFDVLKKSITEDSARNENLICSCGHVSKCLSELILHRNSCSCSEEEKHSRTSPINLTINCSASTRCQHCRHRCKSSIDLLNHLKTCTDASRCQNDSYDSMSMSGGSSGRQEHDDDGAGSEDMGKHPMENRVFVWNKMPETAGSTSSCCGGSGGSADGANISKSDVNGSLDCGSSPVLMVPNGGNSSGSSTQKNEDNSYYGVETAPGYGEVTKKMTPEEEAANSSLKKVYKCPHCSFWASTASRFHVHIVGHLNKKPFECSLCAYRSNWRWDITKHIRLKTIRDPSHKNARVLMNDETGRRNYTKYNKYITLMKVTDEDGDPKLMKSGEMTPNQVASLAFLSDLNKVGADSSLINGLKSSHSQDGDSLSRDQQFQFNQKLETLDAGVDANGLMRLPLLASAMMTAAIAQQKEQDAGILASTMKRSPPPLIKPSDDLITDVKTEGMEKKTFYKCRKCHFRHANRDAVLAHVKIHYQDPLMSFASPNKPNHSTPLQVAVNNTNLYMNKVFAAMCLSQKQLMQDQKSPNGSTSSSNNNNNNINNNNTNNNDNHNSNQHSILSPGASVSSSALHQAISPKTMAAIKAAGTTIEHGEITEEASSSIVVGDSTSACDSKTLSPVAVVSANYASLSTTSATRNAPTASNTTSNATTATSPTTTPGDTSSFIGGASNSTLVVVGVTTTSSLNNDNNERREPSPFRCGHCHQVSNWKHVIQRHCRLKHSGDIRIETLDRNSKLPVYRPLGIQGSGQSCHVLGPSADNYILEAVKAAQQQQQVHNNTSSVLSNDDQQQQKQQPQHRGATDSTFHPSQNFNYELLMNQFEMARLPLEENSSPSNKSKQQKCPLCPYISESKSQMNYHISLHKPSQFECNLCSYVCTKRQHLNNHVKVMHDGAATSSSFVQDTSAAIDLRSKQSHGSDEEESVQKIVSYCSKCPSRFINSIKDLQLHMKSHGAGMEFKCEVCDFSAKQEALLLSHSFVHTNTYQEKTEQAVKFGKEDVENPPKKLGQITLPKTGATLWVVSESKEQTSAVGDNSLLKKQLETGSIKESPSPTASTSVASPCSIAASEVNDTEKCSFCPFQSSCSDTFKLHLQHHICVSKKTKKYTCEHCDFSTNSEDQLADHIKVHFEMIDSNKSVAFFTSYDNLELLVTNEDAKKGETPKPIKFNCDLNAPQKCENIEAEIESRPNLRRSSRPSASANNGDDKLSAVQLPPPPPPPPHPSHKTILVNPKTGQVIRRN